MTDRILVNFDAVHSAAEQVKASAAQIDHLLQELRQGVTKISASWEGAAQQGYRAHQAKWDAKAADLQQACAQIAAALESAAHGYRATETKNTNAWT
ncbi:WXG100 family type VII secretion target [Kitasatospora sp. NPDC059408]|uniref:WXG100 family type VII secretion target n=1 Tax=Kitasatospora sp. NPDC059408 TaxID=3346823 RepID=UPI0036CFE878